VSLVLWLISLYFIGIILGTVLLTCWRIEKQGHSNNLELLKYMHQAIEVIKNTENMSSVWKTTKYADKG
jgi:hypothetical protein